MARIISQQVLINEWTFHYTSLESLEGQLSTEIVQPTELEDAKTTANEFLKCLQELEELTEDIPSCPLADVHNILIDASSIQIRNYLLMNQMRRYEKHYNGYR